MPFIPPILIIQIIIFIIKRLKEITRLVNILKMSNRNVPGCPREKGNTKPSRAIVQKCSQKKVEKKKRCSSAKNWCFTYNNYKKGDIETLITCFESDVSNKFIFGEEIGEKNETPHLQGYISCSKRIRPLEFFKELPKTIHWEVAKGNEIENIKYCSKDGKYYRSKNLKLPRKIKILEESQLYSWQKEIIEILIKEPDDRKIFWIWEPKGNCGKTTFCKYLSLKYGAIPIEGKKNDILYCAANYDSDIYVFDLERSMEDFVSYGAIEKIKNGYYMCAKFESKPIIRAIPHVFIFANFPPDKKALSLDRWVIKKIRNNCFFDLKSDDYNSDDEDEIFDIDVNLEKCNPHNQKTRDDLYEQKPSRSIKIIKNKDFDPTNIIIHN